MFSLFSLNVPSPTYVTWLYVIWPSMVGTVLGGMIEPAAVSYKELRSET